MYTENKTLHVPVIDNGLVPRLCFHRNPTPWTARLLWYAICNMLWVERMRYVMQIRYGSRECNMRIHYGPRECDMRIRYGPRESDMRYTNTLWAVRISDTRIGYALWVIAKWLSATILNQEQAWSKLTVTWQWQLMVLQLISYCVLATILTSYMQVIACHILGCLVQRPCEREGKTFPLSYGPGTTLTVALWIGRWNALSASLQLGTQTYAT